MVVVLAVFTQFTGNGSEMTNSFHINTYIAVRHHQCLLNANLEEISINYPRERLYIPLAI